MLNLIAFATLFTLFTITLKWKISGHMIINSGAIFTLNYILYWQYLWLFAILPLVAFARIYLKKHDLLQVIGGTIVGILVPYAILKVFNLV